jgi:hypothetical protein
VRHRNEALVIGGLVLALAVGAVLLAPPSSDLGPDFQVSGRGPYGLSGLAAGLRAAGMHVSDRDRPTLAAGLTVIVNPQGVTADDAASFMRSLRDGATLVYASYRPDPFTRALGVRYIGGGAAVPGAGAVAFPSARTPPGSPVAVVLPPGGASLYATAGGASEAGLIAVGRGSVWLFADPLWLTNVAAADTGLPVLLPLAASAGSQVSFDRYHQSAGGQLDVLPYLPWWTPLLLLEAAAAGLLLLVAVARRAGPVQAPDVLDPAYLGELAPSLAELYAQGRHLDAVTGPLALAVQRQRGARAQRVAEPLARLRAATNVRDAVQAWHDATTERG